MISFAPPLIGRRPVADVVAAIGNTPLIRLRKASEITGCTILAKAEYANPGGSIKDRTAKFIVEDAEARPTAAELVGGHWLVLRRGKKKFAGVEVR